LLSPALGGGGGGKGHPQGNWGDPTPETKCFLAEVIL